MLDRTVEKIGYKGLQKHSSTFTDPLFLKTQHNLSDTTINLVGTKLHKTEAFHAVHMIDLGRASAISNENNTSLQKDNCRKSIYSSPLTIKSSQLNSNFQKLATTLQIICSKDYVTMAPDLYSSSVRTAAERTKLALKKYTKATHAH
jgi:hypothetical protein